MKNYWKELLLFVLALAGIAFYAYKHIDWNPPKKQAIYSVEVNGKTVPVSEVRVEQIPQAIYDGIADNGAYQEFIVGNTKQVVLFTWDGCPYARAFRRALEEAFTFKILKRYYHLNIVNVGKTSYAGCHSDHLNCPHVWLMNHCGAGICIINPMTKEAIIDTSQNAKQILPLLMAYATWTTDPLLEK